MSEHAKGGGPAFPCEISCDMLIHDEEKGTTEIVTEPYPGMSLRDYLAAKALQGLLANSYSQRTMTQNKSLAGVAYELADAMLAARSA